MVGKQLQDRIVFRQTAVDPASMHASQLPPLAPVHASSLRLNIVTVACGLASRVSHTLSSFDITQPDLSITVVCQVLSTSISPSPAHVITCTSLATRQTFQHSSIQCTYRESYSLV